jgi:hypothetical protein
MVLMAELPTMLKYSGLMRFGGTGPVLAGFSVAACFLIGYLPRRPQQDCRRTLGFMSGDRNASVSLIIASQACNDLKVLVMVTSTVLLMLLILWPAASWYGRRTSRKSV